MFSASNTDKEDAEDEYASAGYCNASDGGSGSERTLFDKKYVRG